MINLFINYFKRYINKILFKKVYPFPKSIKGYKFVKLFSDKYGNTYPNVAVYKNSAKKLAILKLWQGYFKDIDYSTLKNEIKINKIFQQVNSRLNIGVPKEIANVKVPNLIAYKEYKRALILFYEHIEGKTLNECKNELKVDIYFKVLDYIRFIGTKLTIVEKEKINKRTIIQIISLYPILLIKSLITHPNYAPELLKGFVICISNLKKMIRVNYCLSHCDLNFSNILVSKNNIFILDLEYCIFAPELYDLVITLRGEWNSKQLRKDLIKNAQKRFSNKKLFSKVLIGFSINSVTHALTGNNFSKDTIKKWGKFLKFFANIKELERMTVII